MAADNSREGDAPLVICALARPCDVVIESSNTVQALRQLRFASVAPHAADFVKRCLQRPCKILRKLPIDFALNVLKEKPPASVRDAKELFEYLSERLNECDSHALLDLGARVAFVPIRRRKDEGDFAHSAAALEAIQPGNADEDDFERRERINQDDDDDDDDDDGEEDEEGEAGGDAWSDDETALDAAASNASGKVRAAKKKKRRRKKRKGAANAASLTSSAQGAAGAASDEANFSMSFAKPTDLFVFNADSDESTRLMSRYGALLDWIDFGAKANSFLSACGTAMRPSLLDLLRVLVLQPQRRLTFLKVKSRLHFFIS